MISRFLPFLLFLNFLCGSNLLTAQMLVQSVGSDVAVPTLSEYQYDVIITKEGRDPARAIKLSATTVSVEVFGEFGWYPIGGGSISVPDGVVSIQLENLDFGSYLLGILTSLGDLVVYSVYDTGDFSTVMGSVSGVVTSGTKPFALYNAQGEVLIAYAKGSNVFFDRFDLGAFVNVGGGAVVPVSGCTNFDIALHPVPLSYSYLVSFELAGTPAVYGLNLGNAWEDLGSVGVSFTANTSMRMLTSPGGGSIALAGINSGQLFIRNFTGSFWTDYSTATLPTGVQSFDAGIYYDGSRDSIKILYKTGSGSFYASVASDAISASTPVTGPTNNLTLAINAAGYAFFGFFATPPNIVTTKSFCYNPVSLTGPFDFTTPVCEGDPVSFGVTAAYGGPDVLSYLWVAPGIGSVGGNSNTVSTSALTSQSYYLQVYDGCAFVTSASVSATDIRFPLNFITQPNLPSGLCAGDNLSLITEVDDATATYQWFNGTTSVGTGDLFEVSSVTPAINGIYRCDATNVCGTLSSASVDVEVELIPTVSFANATESFCGTEYKLDNVTSTNFIGYQWESSGTGAFVPNAQVPNPIYVSSEADRTAGAVNLTLSSVANVGCSPASGAFDLTFDNSTYPSLNAGADITYSGSAVALNAVATNASAVSWLSGGTGAFNDNTIATPTYTLSTDDLNEEAVELLVKATGNGTCSTVELIDTVFLKSSNVFTLSGTVSFANAKVLLFKKMNGFWTLYASTQVDGANAYTFSNVVKGTYKIQSIQNRAAYFLGNTFDWISSDDVVVSNANLSNLDISNSGGSLRSTLLLSLFNQYFTGSDILVGRILLVFPTNLRTANGGGAEKPIQDATVYLVETDNNTRIDATTTDGNGSYSFTGLNGETYNIEVEYPGTVYETTPTTNNEVDGSSNTVDEVNAAMVKSRASSIDEPQIFTNNQMASVLVFPNPASDKLYLSSEQFANKSLEITVISSGGATLSTYKVNGTSGMLLVPIEALQQGHYFVSITDVVQEKRWTVPFVVNK
jgi:hypothetical protein